MSSATWYFEIEYKNVIIHWDFDICTKYIANFFCYYPLYTDFIDLIIFNIEKHFSYAFNFDKER